MYLSILGSMALIPARTIEQIAVRAAPWVRLGANVLIRKAVARMFVIVSSNVVKREEGGKNDHANSRPLPLDYFRSHLLGIAMATHHTLRGIERSRCGSSREGREHFFFLFSSLNYVIGVYPIYFIVACRCILFLLFCFLVLLFVVVCSGFR
jgi:hypothetical protein